MTMGRAERSRLGRLRCLAAGLCVSSVVLAQCVSPTHGRAATASVMFGVYPGQAKAQVRGGGSTDLTQPQALTAWQGKTDAVLNVFSYNFTDPVGVPVCTQLTIGPLPAPTPPLNAGPSTLFDNDLPAIWANGSVPMISWGPPGFDIAGPDLIVDGVYDAYIKVWAMRLKDFLSGPDCNYSGPNHRRVYIRFAWEANNAPQKWSPAWYDTTAPDAPSSVPPNVASAVRPLYLYPSPSMVQTREGKYRRMWQHVHDAVMAAGLDAAHVQWVFSVSQHDFCGTSPTYCDPRLTENLYPGESCAYPDGNAVHACVDWTGMDGYSDSHASPQTIFDPMLNRLATIAPNKPQSIDEMGVYTETYWQGCGEAQPSSTATPMQKDQWISTFFTSYLPASRLQVVVWWNTDGCFGDGAMFSQGDWTNPGKKGNPSACSGTSSDQYCTVSMSATYYTWAAYKRGISQAFVIGGDVTNPLVITDDRFEGKCLGGC